MSAFSIRCFYPVIPAKAGIQMAASAVGLARDNAPYCQNQDFQDWRDFQDFTFAQPAFFAIIENLAKTNTDD